MQRYQVESTPVAGYDALLLGTTDSLRDAYTTLSELTEAVIKQHLKALKLPAMRREYRNARQAGADSWTFEDYLRGTARP